MNSIQISNFLTITKAGSFTKAEDILNTTKTALKKQMDTLEIELGFTLFYRTPKGLELTVPGRLYLEKVSKLYYDHLNLIEECKSISKQAQTNIRIGMYNISSMMDWYLNIEQHSQFKIDHIYLSNLKSSHQDNLDLLKEDKIDFLEYEDNELIFKQNYSFTPIVKDPLCCIMKSSHSLAQYEALHPSELQGYTLYCWTASSTATRGLFNYANRYKLDLQAVPYSVNSVLNICSSGNIYILSSTLAQNFKPLKIIPIDSPLRYTRGLAYKPIKNTLLQDMLHASEPILKSYVL